MHQERRPRARKPAPDRPETRPGLVVVLVLAALSTLSAQDEHATDERPGRSFSSPRFQLSDRDPGGAPSGWLRTPGRESVAGAGPRDRTWRYHVDPPAGMIPLPSRDELSGESHKDPTQNAFFLVNRVPLVDSLEETKRLALRELISRFDGFRILRDEARDARGDDAAFGARWIVELEAEIGSATFRQTQVFADLGDRVLVLTYTAESPVAKTYELAFRRSMESLRISLDPLGPQVSGDDLQAAARQLEVLDRQRERDARRRGIREPESGGSRSRSTSGELRRTPRELPPPRIPEEAVPTSIEEAQAHMERVKAQAQAAQSRASRAASLLEGG